MARPVTMQGWMRMWALVAVCRLVAAQVALPAVDGCFMGSGFSFDSTQGCSVAPAMQSMEQCSPSTPTDLPCLQQERSEEMTSYVMDVRSASDHETLTKAIIGAEGGGFGVTVSASAQYMQESHTTDTSVAFFVGAAGKVRVDSIRDPMNMRLNEGAKKLLKNNPTGFLQTHGLRYVHTVVYGGSFLGSFTMNSRSTSSVISLGVAEKLSASRVFFEASASEEFEMSARDHSEDITIFSNAKWRGGSGVSLDPASPNSMGQTFTQWSQSFRENPVAQLIVLRPWIDSADVQAIVSDLPPTVQRAFDAPTILRETRDEISAEFGRTQLVLDSVNLALSWDAVQRDDAIKDGLGLLQRQAKSHMFDMAGIAEAELVMRQVEVIQGNYSWFISGDLQDRYQTLVASLPRPTSADVWSMHWGGGGATHRETWPDIDVDVQAVFVDPGSGTTYIIKHGMVKAGDSWQHWPQVDETVQAAWLWRDQFYVIKGGMVCRVPWGSSDPCSMSSWPLIDGAVQAAWVWETKFYVIKSGSVWLAEWGSSDYSSQAWPSVDATVRTAWLEGDIFYVVKPSAAEAKASRIQVEDLII